MRTKWTDEEIATLRRIYRGKESIKVAVDRLLPHRGYFSARDAARRHGFAGKTPQGKAGRSGYSWLLAAIEAALAQDVAMTNRQIADRLGVDESSVAKLTRKYHGKKFRIAGWARVGERWAMRWDSAKLPDVPKPPPQTSTQSCRVWRARGRVRAGSPANHFSMLIKQVTA